VHRLLARAQPSFSCVLLIESGPRKVTEQFLPFLYQVKGAVRVDLLTCYNAPPRAFDFDRGVVYSVNDQEVRQDRTAFIRKLSSGPYTVLALMLTGLPIMTRWKWMLAFRSSARLIAVNEEAKYFGLEIWNHRSMGRMLLQRLNPFADYTRDSLAAMLVRFLLGLFIAPFTIAYLLLYTGFVHVRRALRGRKPLAS
jgi:hypothetical protein